VSNFLGLVTGDRSVITHILYPYLDADSAVNFSCSAKCIYSIPALLTDKVAKDVIWHYGAWYHHLVLNQLPDLNIAMILHLKPDALMHKHVYELAREKFPHLLCYSIALAKQAACLNDIYIKAVKEHLGCHEEKRAPQAGCVTVEEYSSSFLSYIEIAPDQLPTSLSFFSDEKLVRRPKLFEKHFKKLSAALEFVHSFYLQQRQTDSYEVSLPPETLFFLFNFWHMSFHYLKHDTKLIFQNSPHYVKQFGFLVEFAENSSTIKEALQDSPCWLFLLHTTAFEQWDVREHLEIPDHIEPTAKAAIEYFGPWDNGTILAAIQRYPHLGHYLYSTHMNTVEIHCSILEHNPYFYTSTMLFNSLKLDEKGLLKYPPCPQSDAIVSRLQHQFNDDQVELAKLFGRSSAAILQYAPPKLLADTSFLLTVMAPAHANLLQHCPEELSSNRSFVQQVLEANPDAFYWAAQYNGEEHATLRTIFFDYLNKSETSCCSIL
jgi:hypothetical protein